MTKSAQTPERLSTPRSRRVAATLGKEVIASLSAAKTGEVVPTLDEFADQEAQVILEGTQTRIQIWAQVISAYGNDLQLLKDYPQKVRHAFGKRLGIDFSVPIAEWEATKQRLYKSFVTNQVGPIANLIGWLKSGQTTKEAVIAFLSGPGTVNDKIKAIPFKQKKRQSKGPDQVPPRVSDKPDDASIATMAEESVKKYGAVNSALAIINNAVVVSDLPFVLQASARKLIESGKEHEKELGEKVRLALAAYDVATGVKEDSKIVWPEQGTKQA